MTEFKQLLQSQKSLCRQHQGLDLVQAAMGSQWRSMRRVMGSGPSVGVCWSAAELKMTFNFL